jgi:hypothetical protein
MPLVPIQLLAGLEDRFWPKVSRLGHKNDCWHWRGWKNEDGYGFIAKGRGDATPMLAHRVSWLVHNKPKSLTSKQCVMHSCDNPGCVNPNHLRIGTQAENTADRHSKDRTARGERLNRGVLNEDLVRKIRQEASRAYTALGKKYGCSRATIRQVVQGKTWRHVC